MGIIMASVKCPILVCGGIGMPADTKKKFSFGKAIVCNTVWYALGGPVCGIVGAATGIKCKNGKTKFVCSKCGKVFEKKI